jgi:hypothetical protein
MIKAYLFLKDLTSGADSANFVQYYNSLPIYLKMIPNDFFLSFNRVVLMNLINE